MMETREGEINFQLLIQKASSIFDKASMPFWKMFLSLKQLFDAKMIIKRLSYFSVSKFQNKCNLVYKVAVNIVNLKSLMKKRSYP